MSRFLIATWDGAGNLVPTLAIARRLAAAGHDVRLLGHPAIAARAGTHGWRFRPFHRTDPLDSAVNVSPPPDWLARDLWCGTAPARDVLDELAREAADVLVADCMLAGALTAGEASRVPTAALFHGAFTLFRQGPLASMLAGALPGLNRLRAALGLPGVSAFSELHDRSCGPS